MLQALGSAEKVTADNHPCCDVCDRNKIPATLNFEALPSSSFQKRSTRRTAVRIVDKDLETKLRENLEAEREAYILEHPSFQMLGPNFVCANSVIDKICLDAKFIVSNEDLNILSIGTEIKTRLLRVILSTLSVAPTPRRHNLYSQY